MEKRERDLLHKIEEGSENVAVPDSLKPENIKKKLEQQAWEERKRKRRRNWQYAGVAAACVVLVAGIAVYQNQKKSDLLDIYPVNESRQEDQGEYAKNYKEIRKYLAANKTSEKETAEYEATVDVANTSKDYSTTNVRQDGVNEADVAKTDGRYLYVAEDYGDCIFIVDTKTNMKKVSKINAPKGQVVKEIYLTDDNKKVVLLCSCFSDEEPYEGIEDITKGSLKGKEAEGTKVLTYDVQDKAHPKKISEVSQSGSYVSSRISDGYIYLFSEYYVPDNWKKKHPITYIPCVNGELMDAKDICLPAGKSGCTYKIISSIDLKKTDKVTDSKAIFTECGEIYVSNKNIYHYEDVYNDSGNNTKTTLRKFSYKKGKLAFVAKKIFTGELNDSFSLDEYKGYLRMVVTKGKTNAVYILDSKLKVTGKITNLAKDERVYSARFLGDTGYFVTYKETDPLFSVDLSDPKNPKILGQLKIPGFSNYLHFYGKDLLLGIGMDVDVKGDVTNGVKLSMFDISNKKNVKELHKYILKNAYSTSVEVDYKAALIDVKKNMIAFPAESDGGNFYCLFAYTKEKGFQLKMKEKIHGSGVQSTRGIYIGNRLYVISGNVLEAHDLKNYKKIDDCVL